MTYQQLEKMSQLHNRKICIFGAGMIGRTWGYDVLVAAGFKVDYYCDNKLPSGIEIQKGVKTIAFEELCQLRENIHVFITVNEKLQEEIEQQLRGAGINDYVFVGYLFLQEFCESVLEAQDAGILEKYKALVNDESFLKRLFLYKVGYELDLDNPKTFNEKLQWLKLHDRNPEYTKLVDKYEFKKIIAERIGKEYIIPTLGVWENVDQIEWDMLPKQFVLKCTHDSGSVIICKDKDTFDVEAASKKLDKAMKRNFYWSGREWPYKDVIPRIVAETYLEDVTEEVIDYKFLCYNGVFKFAFTCTERFSKDKLKVTFFDREWNKLAIKRHYDISQKNIAKPHNFKKMIEIAENISSNYPFVRVDFYEINGKVYLGEFTLYPGCGFEEFERYEDDLLLGKYIECGV